MGHLITLATCALNQWALDYEGNRDRIIQSIIEAKAAGASLRVGPELEVSGYSCEDHFLENDTFLHCWEMYAQIISDERVSDILLDIGMPVRHRNVRYNTRIISYNKKILLIRPKKYLAGDGNYYEMRWFTPWLKDRHVEDYYLESIVSKITGQRVVPFGDALISSLDTCLGAETCEELFCPDPPHAQMGLAGCEIFTNSSGSYHELRKFDTRRRLIQEATAKTGGIYLYANQKGVDGQARLYFDGCAMIFCNGKLLAQGAQFGMKDVEVVTATIDLEEVRSFRCAPSRGLQAQLTKPYQRIEVSCRLSVPSDEADVFLSPTPAIEPRIHSPAEEIALGPANWLWDYLRRCGAAGFFIPLSGGVDSCSTSLIVFSMCREVVKSVGEGNEQVLKDVRRITGVPDYYPTSPQDLCNKIFSTAYMGTDNSSRETRARAKDLATDIGAYHVFSTLQLPLCPLLIFYQLDMNIQIVVNALQVFFTTITGFHPRYSTQGGTLSENLALQNIQARLRMCISYLFAQMIPTVRSKRGSSLLVLGSANVVSLTTAIIDSSSADLNPIGAISKVDLVMFVAYARDTFHLPVLQEFLDATPTAELIPLPADASVKPQSDEEEMGMTYQELDIFGRLRKVAKLGPWGMYERLSHEWSGMFSPIQIAEKVKRFYHFYAINRHKVTVLTPSYHAEQYSPDDNRHDFRPFLYPRWSWPFQKIDDHSRMMEERKTGKKAVKGD
ncbi:MAG: glutamine-dependent NAD(+) synthetase [Cirrosporium novae-zelandiae]|nr:MAG: glutamine-dependent NAD(+) synthetase [Cirrosporium novae-zelandiae]